MNRLKKLGVLALMCAFLVGLIPVSKALASEVEEPTLPQFFEVTGVGIIYEYYNTTSKMVAVVNQGNVGIAFEKMDWADGTEWYYVHIAEYEGYIPKSEVTLKGALPNTNPGPTPTPIPDDGFVGVVETAKGFAEMIGAVPLMIASFFSFLPAWCLALAGVGFAFLVTYMVIKIIRG